MSYREEPGSLDAEAALLLGQLLIGQSRMELALQKHAESGGDIRRAGFVQWTARAREFEPLARSLREARWLPDPRRNVVLFVPAPGDPHPAPRSLTIAELRRTAVEQKELLAHFHRLCALERGLVAEQPA
jgi:hypothetical protein